MIKNIHALGLKAGVAIKPGTPVDVLYPLLEGSGEKPDVRFFSPLSFFLTYLFFPIHLSILLWANLGSIDGTGNDGRTGLRRTKVPPRVHA